MVTLIRNGLKLSTLCLMITSESFMFPSYMFYVLTPFMVWVRLNGEYFIQILVNIVEVVERDSLKISD